MPRKLSAILFLLLAFALRVKAQEAIGFDEITLENIRQIGLIASTEITSINDLAWSPDGAEVAVASDDGFWIYDWRANSRDQFEVTREVSRVAFIPNTSHLAVSFGDETSIYDATDRFQRIATFPHGFQAISPDGSIYAASNSENITLYSLKDGSIVQQIQVKVFDKCLGGCSIFDVAFSPDREFLAFSSAAEDAESGIINLRTSEKRSSVQLGMSGLAISPNSALIASWGGHPGYLSGPVLITDSITGQSKASIQVYGNYAAPAFSRDGRLLVIGGGDPTQGIPYETQGMLLYSFDIEQVVEKQVIEDFDVVAAIIDVTRRQTPISSTVFSPDYQLLAVGDSYNGQLTLWGVRSHDAGS